jgi:hypothetical protein
MFQAPIRSSRGRVERILRPARDSTNRDWLLSLAGGLLGLILVSCGLLAGPSPLNVLVLPGLVLVGIAVRSSRVHHRFRRDRQPPVFVQRTTYGASRCIGWLAAFDPAVRRGWSECTREQRDRYSAWVAEPRRNKYRVQRLAEVLQSLEKSGSVRIEPD